MPNLLDPRGPVNSKTLQSTIVAAITFKKMEWPGVSTSIASNRHPV